METCNNTRCPFKDKCARYTDVKGPLYIIVQGKESLAHQLCKMFVLKTT